MPIENKINLKQHEESPKVEGKRIDALLWLIQELKPLASVLKNGGKGGGGRRGGTMMEVPGRVREGKEVPKGGSIVILE